jgi:hypothetical protein
MINWNDIKNFDITDIDLTRFDLSSIELPRFEMPTIDLPDVELPKVELPDVELPKLPEMPEIDVPVEEVAGFARDAAYATVGAVVITAQKADERRRELTDQVTTQVRKLVDSVA